MRCYNHCESFHASSPIFPFTNCHFLRNRTEYLTIRSRRVIQTFKKSPYRLLGVRIRCEHCVAYARSSRNRIMAKVQDDLPVPLQAQQSEQQRLLRGIVRLSTWVIGPGQLVTRPLTRFVGHMSIDAADSLLAPFLSQHTVPRLQGGCGTRSAFTHNILTSSYHHLAMSRILLTLMASLVPLVPLQPALCRSMS